MIRRSLSLPVALALLAAAAHAAAGASASAEPRRPDLGGHVRVWVANLDSGTVLPIDTRTRRAGRPVRVHNPFGLAITPEGRRILVVGLRKVTLISTATARSARPVTVGRFPDWPVISLDGRTAYIAVRNTVVPVSIAGDKAGRPITVASKGGGPQGLAIAPDGKTVYAVNFSDIRPIDTRTRKAGVPIRTGGVTGGMVITPDGRTGYVASTANTVIPVDLATGTTRKPIKIEGPPDIVPALIITPDGKTLYVADDGNRTVIPISTATNTAGTPVKVGQLPSHLAVTPNGKTVYVTTFHAVYPISTSTGRAGQPITVTFIPLSVVITPDGKTAWVSGVRDKGRLNDRQQAVILPISTAGSKPGKVITTGKGDTCAIIRPWRSGHAIGPSSCNT